MILFFPTCCFEPAILEEGVCDHFHERMTMQTLPGSALEVIETEFFFQLLVSLLANPTCLDGSRQAAQPAGWRHDELSAPVILVVFAFGLGSRLPTTLPTVLCAQL